VGGKFLFDVGKDMEMSKKKYMDDIKDVSGFSDIK